MTKRVVKRKVKKKKPLPAVPSVTSPLSYGKNEKGEHIIPKFVISENGKNYVIVNMETGDLAEKTSSTGYPYKEAVRIATWFVKNRGAYTTSPF